MTIRSNACMLEAHDRCPDARDDSLRCMCPCHRGPKRETPDEVPYVEEGVSDPHMHRVEVTVKVAYKINANELRKYYGTDNIKTAIELDRKGLEEGAIDFWELGEPTEITSRLVKRARVQEL